MFSLPSGCRTKQTAVGSTKQRGEMTMMFDDTIKLYATSADDDHYSDELKTTTTIYGSASGTMTKKKK